MKRLLVISYYWPPAGGGGVQRVAKFCKYLPEFGETDIGYRFVRHCWGQGLATESALPLMAYGREVLGLERIVGLVDPENVASARVLVKLGLAFEGKRFIPEIGSDMDVYA